MILLLGGTGYIGSAFAKELQRRKQPFTALSRKELDYTSFPTLLKFLQEKRPAFVVNAAGYTGKPNVDACETARADTLQGNTLLPHTIAHACAATGTPWGHVSSGCIFTGAKVTVNGRTTVEKDLTRPDLRKIVDGNRAAISGYGDRRAEFLLPPAAVQFLQRHQGARGGGHRGRRPELRVAAADSVR